jgi:hypothetical protein
LGGGGAVGGTMLRMDHTSHYVENYLARSEAKPIQRSLVKCNYSTTKEDIDKVKTPRGAPRYGDIKIQLSVLISQKRWGNREISPFKA